MSWFNVIKTLQSKTGYAQLDFDNIIEEEDDDCKRKVKQIFDNFKNMKFESKPYRRDNNFRSYKFGEKYHVLTLYHMFNENYPEEVFCKMLELLIDGKKLDSPIKIGDAALTMLVENERNHKTKMIMVHRESGSLMMLGYIYHFRDGNKDEQFISKLESAFNVV